MPLTPKLAFMAYDGDVYSLDKLRKYINTDKEFDINIINEFQFLKANENIFFSCWGDQNKLLKQLEIVKPKRPNTWHKVNYAVIDTEVSNEEGTVFKFVHTIYERRAAKQALIHIEEYTDKWPSFLKYRYKKKFIDTKSGAGLIRLSASRYL